MVARSGGHEVRAGGRTPGSRVRRGGSGAARPARVQEDPSARLTPVPGVQLGVHQRDGRAACAWKEGHSGKGEGPPRLPGGALRSCAGAQSWKCLGFCEGAGSGSPEGAGRDESAAFLLTAPVLVLEPVLFVLRDLVA